jgi:hypothetical protein
MRAIGLRVPDQRPDDFDRQLDPRHRPLQNGAQKDQNECLVKCDELLRQEEYRDDEGGSSPTPHLHRSQELHEFIHLDTYRIK